MPLLILREASWKLAELIRGGRFGRGGGATTRTEALPEMPATVAITLPLPALEPAVNTVEPPAVRESVPRVDGVTDQAAAATETGLPKASPAETSNGCEACSASEADAGETATTAAGPGSIASACDPLAVPTALAVSTALPAVVSS